MPNIAREELKPEESEQLLLLPGKTLFYLLQVHPLTISPAWPMLAE